MCVVQWGAGMGYGSAIAVLVRPVAVEGKGNSGYSSGSGSIGRVAAGGEALVVGAESV